MRSVFNIVGAIVNPLLMYKNLTQFTALRISLLCSLIVAVTHAILMMLARSTHKLSVYNVDLTLGCTTVHALLLTRS